jgi:hypothetical protein
MPEHQSLSLSVIEQHVYVIRDQRVMLDEDLAELYGIETRVLNQAVSRNLDRFPADFMFKLTVAEFDNLKSQFVTSSWGGRRKLPRAFTEQGVAMLSSVLRSERAVQANIAIMRAFVRMREAMISHKDLASRLDDMERKYDAQFSAVFDALRQLMQPLPAAKKSIGYIHPVED